MIKILAVICSTVTADDCREVTVTSSDFADLTIAGCLVGEPAVAKWMLENHPGYRLAKWVCQIGRRERI